MDTQRDFIALEDMLKAIHSGSQLALVRLASLQKKIQEEKGKNICVK
jgi:hypothetical protein